MSRRFKLAVLNSHPIQYFAPLYRRIAQTEDIDLLVYYCSKQGTESGFVDSGFGKEVVWDTPLLEGYRHRFLPNAWGDHGVGGFFSLLNPSIIGELRRERFDALLVHGHNSATNLIALAFAKLIGTRVFMRGETHGRLARGRLKRALRKPVMSTLYRFCDACLYIGTLNREFYSLHGVGPQKLFFVPYTIDNDAFARRTEDALPMREELRERLGIPQGLPIVLFASKLTRRKRARDAILAHVELARRGINLALLIVGDGEERRSLEDLVARTQARNVVFAGFANQSEIPQYFAISDVLVLPSESEPWGLIINEAMASGLPVVATDEVGAAIDLIVEGLTGAVYPVGDIGRLADALQRVIAADGADRSRIREDCRRHMATWSYAECIEGIRQALRARAGEEARH